jgi:hypothetical protein
VPRNIKKLIKAKYMIIEEKINLQLSKMSQQHKKIYKKRIIVENLFATIKAIPRF